MEIHRLPADEDAVHRYVEDLWLPYHRELQALVDDYALAGDVDVVPAEVEFRLDKLEAKSYRAWVAVDDAGEDSAERVLDGELAGFITTDVDEPPSVFDRPDRLFVGDIYVRESYRGTGLARDLLARAAERAREVGCAELRLDVDVDNERAVAFYEKLGFETRRRQLALATDDF